MHFFNPFYFARISLAEHISDLAGSVVGKTLDVGCGKMPYKNLFNSTQYVGLEFDTHENRKLKSTDYFYDSKSFPFADQLFDSVVCNQVLEHVFTPDQFVSEINRVLKDGGIYLMTVPFVWNKHEQQVDYARYSSFGLKTLLNRNGFDVIEQRKTLTNVSVIFQIVNAYIYKITQTRSRLINLLLAICLISPVTIVGICTSMLLPSNYDLYLDNVVLARKSEMSL